MELNDIEFFELEDQFICRNCFEKMIQETREGKLTGDERVTRSMATPAGNHGQCDNCNQQCDDYPDCEEVEWN